jgi:hypothetical protein
MLTEFTCNNDPNLLPADQSHGTACCSHWEKKMNLEKDQTLRERGAGQDLLMALSQMVGTLFPM